MDIKAKLSTGLLESNLDVSADQQTALLYYVQMLVKWNASYNLTAIRQPDEMITKHILDSLVILPYVTGQRMLDVGTGAGLPGIPLAICQPDKEFYLLDSNGKKARFLVQVKHELGLENIHVLHTRVEDYHPELLFDVILSRAFSSLLNMLQSTAHLVHEQGVFMAMKGNYPRQEIGDIPKNFTVFQEAVLQVPRLDGQRHLILMRGVQP